MATEGIDVAQMGTELMAQIERDYGSGTPITAALMIVNVDKGGEDTMHVKPSPGLSRHVGVGLVESAKHHFLAERL